MNFKVCIYSKRKGFSQQLADVITDMGFHCDVIPGFRKLFRYMKETKDLSLLLIDEQTYAVPYFDVQEHVLSHNRHFAVHFLYEIRATNMVLNGLEYNAYYDIMHELRPILIKNRDYYRIVEMTGVKRTEEEKDLLHKYHLRPSHVPVIKYLEGHKDRDIHLDSMSRYLWPAAESERIQTLYAYINQMRSILPDLNPTMIIERISKNTYWYHDSSVPVKFAKN